MNMVTEYAQKSYTLKKANMERLQN